MPVEMMAPARGRAEVGSPAQGSPRPLTTLHPSVAGRYTALVASIAGAIEGDLSTAVMANRVALATPDPPRLRLRPWAVERRAFLRALRELSSRAGCLALSDVRDCYPSVSTMAIGEALEGFGCDPRVVVNLASLLRRLRTPGLPVGPVPSAVLANAVLSRADRALEAAGFRHLRWVDDVVIAADDPGTATRALGVFETALRSIGLEPNLDKTRVVVDPASLPITGSISAGRRRVLLG